VIGGDTAFGGATWQVASDIFGNRGPSVFGGVGANAVDGNEDGDLFDGSVAQTALQGDPEWGVLLTRLTGLRTIKIWGRSDCCTDRLNGANVWIRRGSNDHTWDFITTLIGTGTLWIVNVPNPSSRVYSDAVAVVLPGSPKQLALAEVEAFGD
jgi:hypothetical protein